MKFKHYVFITVTALILASLVLAILPLGVKVSVKDSFLSISLDKNESVKAAENTVTQTAWGYQYTLMNGDVVEVGDSTTPDFHAQITTIRGACSWSMRLGNDTYAASLDDMTVTFAFNRDIDVHIYPVAPDEKIDSWRIEYDVTLNKKTNQASISFNCDWTGITWEKILALDVEYDEAACEEKFGVEAAPYTITPTSITGSDSHVYLTRAEWEVNSYVGTAIDPTLGTPEIIGINKNNGQPITRSSPSRTHLRILRGQMTDALNNQAYVEDINLDEENKILTFTLPAGWLKTANYPVQGVCGTDPAYTEDMQYVLTDTNGITSDGWNADIDFNSIFGCPVSSVAEVIFGNQEAGVENTFGLRNTSSALNRIVIIHEAEGGGMTHCRMFVQLDASGLCDVYHSDVSDDDYFYLVGYWENVTFTELYDAIDNSSGTGWYDISTALSDGASCVHHVVVGNGGENAACYGGVREKGSVIDRYIYFHEQENDGYSYLDWMVKADASKIIETYQVSPAAQPKFYDLGYFDSSLDFVELWEENTTKSFNSWGNWDITAYLDEDGRLADFMLANGDDDDTRIMGVRDGDDTSTNRYLVEHESESAGGTEDEFTGFSMSAQSNSSGVIQNYFQSNLGNNVAKLYLTGYFKPAGGITISNSPSTWTLNAITGSGKCYPDTIYYSNPQGDTTSPSSTVQQNECQFLITNTSSVAIDLTANMTDFSGGSDNSTNSNTGANGATSYGAYCWYNGETYSNKGIMKSSGSTLGNLISNLAATTNLYWGAEVETQSNDWTGGTSATATITITATIH